MKKQNRRKFLATSAIASIGTLRGIQTLFDSTSGKEESKTATGTVQKSTGKSKRDLMMQVLDMSSRQAYIPAGFFMHFGVTGDAAVKAHLDYFHATGMDFLKIQFDEQSLPKNDEIKTPQDWAKIPVYPESWFEPALYLLRNLVKNAKKEALIIQTVYSPYQMAKQAVPWDLIVKHIREDAESVSRGMENITLSILNFINAASRIGADGFYTCSQGGETNRIADLGNFYRIIKSYDMLLYKEASQQAPFNIMHICDYDGFYSDFRLRFFDYPGQVINVPLTADNKPLTLNEAAEIFKRPVMGGLDRHGVISTGSPDEVRKATVKILQDAPPNVILGADCTIDRKTPIENIKTAIDTAHSFRA